ncbi:MAG: hypothetical protein M1830_007127, partial [Pleopsidium flavum]
MGEKVRFLGCVAKYTTSTALLTLQHKYPTSSPTPSTASVDVNLLLSTLKSTDTQFGEWVNVIGYVALGPVPESRVCKTSAEGARRVTVFVQAVMLWSAGSVNLGEYEKVLEERRAVARR